MKTHPFPAAINKKTSAIGLTLWLLLLTGAVLSASGCGQQGSGSPIGGPGGLVEGQSKVLADDLMINNAVDDQSTPDAAYDTVNNRYFTVWTDERAPLSNGLDIYGAFVNGITNSLDGAAFRISESAADETQPKVAFDEVNERYLVVWTDTGEGTGRIYGRFVNASGTMPDASFLVSQGEYDAGAEAVFGDTGYSELTTYWIDGGTNITDTRPYYIFILDQSQETPSVVFNKVTGKFIVSWMDSTNRDQSYFYDYFYATGSRSVCSNNFGDALITNSDTSGDADIFYAPFTHGSVSDNSMVRYRDVTYADFSDGDAPAVIDVASGMYNGSSLFNLTGGDWDESPIDSDIQNYSRLTYIDPLAGETDCQSESESLTLSAKFSLMDSESSPVVTYNPVKGTPYIIWSGKSKVVTMAKTWNRAFDDVTGWTAWGVTKTTYDTVTSDTNQRIYLRTMSFNVATDLALSEESSESVKPSAAVDKYKKRMLVAWEGRPSGDKNIYAQLIDMENNLPYSGIINASTEQYAQTAPKVSYNSDKQNYFVVWEDARNTVVNLSNMDIFGQFVEPTGQLLGGNFPVTVRSSNQLDPSIAFGDEELRRFLIVWKDAKEIENSDIYGQLWTALPTSIDIKDGDNNPIPTQAIDFGNVRLAQADTKVFRIWNNGGAPLTISSFTGSPEVSINTTPDISKPFNITTPVPTTINPGTYYEMSVQFSPPQSGSYNGSVTIDSDGGKTNLYFSGAGVSPNIQLNIPSAVSSMTSIINNYKEEVFTVSNTGNATLNITSIATESPFVITSESSAALAPGQSKLVTLRFSPSAGGVFSKYVTLVSDDPDESIKSFLVKGEAIDLLSIPSSNMSDAIIGAPYTATLNASGGKTPYSWSYSGTLPPGLGLDTAAGIISGTPTTTGTYNFTVSVVDSSAPQTASKDFTVVVATATTINITTTSLGSWTINVLGFTNTITSAGGVGPFSWSISAGNLPSGLVLDASATGSSTTISGLPTSSGNFSFTAKVTDSSSPPVSGTKDFEIDINPTPLILTTSLSSGLIGETYNETINGSGGTAPVLWSVASGSLPPGLSLNTSTGVIDGVPSASDALPYAFTVRRTDALGVMASRTYSISISDLLSIDTVGFSNAVLGVPYSAYPAASGGRVPYTWSNSDYLPTGVTMTSAVTGRISGTPSEAGTFYFSLTVTDKDGNSKDKDFSIIVEDSGGTTGGTGDGDTTTPTTTTTPVATGSTESGACFIATAAYGSYLDPNVKVLRDLRDNYMLTNAPGRAFVAFYYKNSPPVADFIGRHEALRTAARIALTPVIYSVKYPLMGIGLILLAGIPVFPRLRKRLIKK